MSLVKHAVRCAIAAGAAAVVANTASALDISAYNAATVVNVYLSGSTAVDNTLVNSLIETATPKGLCQPGTLDIYYVGTTGSYTNRLMFCAAASPQSGLAAGTPLVIYKESAVGSANGVSPLYNVAGGVASGLTFLNPATLTDAACGAAVPVGASGNLSNYVNHPSCTSATTAAPVPSAGFADVEASILHDAGDAPLSAAKTTQYLKSTGTLDQLWAVPLTKNAYYAIQAAEGLGAGDAPGNAPTLSKEDVAGLISGNVFDWSDLGGLTPPATNSSVIICRRDNGSGTHASFGYGFLGQRCSLSSETIPAEDGAVVWANASGGAMRSCLQHMYAGGTQTAFYSSASHTFTSGQQWAIGMLNDEVTTANLTGASDSFRFVAVDGSGPTVANVQNGFYPYFSTGVAYTIKSGSHILGNAANGTGAGDSANSLTAVNALLAVIGHPQFTSDSNQNYLGVLPWSSIHAGAVGDLSPAGVYAAGNVLSAIPSTSTIASGNPTNQYTKSASGTVNNCDTPVWDSGDLEGLSTTALPKTLLGTGNVND
jgi:hypothetical protein